MSVIRPFRGIRYSTQPGDNLSTRIAPPYDVLSAEDRAAYLARDPRNFLAIDLPHVPPKAAGPQPAYDAAAATMRGWLADGTLVRDVTQTIYVYHQGYTHGGRAYTRKKFFAALRLEEFGRGSVFPHEQTFGGPKEDRLALMKATGAALSPIFGLYEDATNEVARLLETDLPRTPLLAGALDGVESRVWAVTDPATIDRVATLLRDRPTFIADGHHRYGTALLYRQWLIAKRGPLAPEHPANFALCVFCAMEDEGLLILPTHRVLPRVALNPALLRADAELDVQLLPAQSADEAVAALARFGPQAVALHCASEPGYAVIRPRRSNLLDPLAPERSPAWRALGLAFLHAYLLDRVVARHAAAPEISYVKSAEAAVADARATGGSVFLLQPTTMQELRAVCQAGDLMPQKSTYFFPKLASGLIVKLLDE